MSERKFTFGNLEIRTLILSDYLYLGAYSCAVLGFFYAGMYVPEKKFAVSFFTSWLIGFHTISSPFGLRFRNIYFSAVWLLLSLAFLIGNNYGAYVPLLTFLLYHIIRAVFWKKHNREFIPFHIGKGAIARHRSGFENRAGNKKDKAYTVAMLLIGIVMILSTLFLLIQNKDYR